ncbi:hypothetical protein FRB90_011481 [Tulasnella sp. 427]|nr:hypothetical protein FRB90_011481 [Tulasnella sp. 427]
MSFKDVEAQVNNMRAELANKEKFLLGLVKQLGAKEQTNQDLKKQLDAKGRTLQDLRDQLNATRESEEHYKWAVKNRKTQTAQVDSVLLSKLEKLFQKRDNPGPADQAARITRAAPTSWRSRAQTSSDAQTETEAGSTSQIEGAPVASGGTSVIAQAVSGLSDQIDQMAITAIDIATAEIVFTSLESQRAQTQDQESQVNRSGLQPYRFEAPFQGPPPAELELSPEANLVPKNGS